jgi:hypothetical protein
LFEQVEEIKDSKARLGMVDAKQHPGIKLLRNWNTPVSLVGSSSHGLTRGKEEPLVYQRPTKIINLEEPTQVVARGRLQYDHKSIHYIFEWFSVLAMFCKLVFLVFQFVRIYTSKTAEHRNMTSLIAISFFIVK